MTTAPQFARVCMSRSKDIVATAHFGTYETTDKTRINGFDPGCIRNSMISSTPAIACAHA